MIYFLLDSSGLESFTAGLARTLPRMASRVRLVEYSQLVVFEELPAGAYVFMDLLNSSEPRRQMAEIVGEAIRAHGSQVWNLPSSRQSGGHDLGLWTLGEGTETIRYPALLRTRQGDRTFESMPFECEDDLLAAVSEAIVEGYEAEDLSVHAVPEPEQDGKHRLYACACIGAKTISIDAKEGASWPPSRLSAVGPTLDFRATLAESAGLQVGRVEYVLKDNKVTVWKVDDGPLALWPELNGNAKHRFAELLESALEELDCDGEGKIPLAPCQTRFKMVLHESVK